MPKPKRKLTAAEKQARKERKKNFMIIFINGKQKRVRRPQLIEGLPADEFIGATRTPFGCIRTRCGNSCHLMASTCDRAGPR